MTLFLALTAYFAVMNIVTFLVYRSDKKRAEKGARRTRERTLHLLALAGGALGAFLGMRICRHKTQKLAFRATVLPLMILQVLTWVMVAALTAYASGYYHADDTAQDALTGDMSVKVTHKADVYAFDGPGSSDALVFYPGGLVEATAYAPLLHSIAAQGVDCYLVEMPYYLAFFGLNKAGDIMNANHYDHWYIAGHSLGGVTASQFARGHADQLDGIIFLASYSTDLLPSNLHAACIHGTKDKVISASALENNHVNLPDGTIDVVIEGGNHCQYGNYGFQKGDGEASISAKEQQRITAEAIINLVRGK